MGNIIAGRFDQQISADEARAEILRAGFAEEQVSTFYVSPPGQHDMTLIGGDEIKSHGAEHTERGIAKGGIAGGVVGAVIGAATMPVIGPVAPVVGALVGAHVGDLAGSLSETEDDGTESGTLPYRRSGMMLAISAASEDEEARAVRVLRELQALDIERAEGTIANGDWEDFDPLQPPRLVDLH
ncbi:hypothetical protein EDC30_11042 [Paucimonas lemoignei]|uniref:Glycine zipper domain-containing protein n=1 Tax=Paucimonas lemoignei TaxID=29443 RepID=A0A4R3HSE3_PAULE|nr:hypothetical protein [Paucimonas lemoignei]TCS35574.1 hypothetical protein EDC30_11042 [Paucimonas lemoignei]